MIKPIVALILISSLVYGLDCQYPVVEEYQEEEIRMFLTEPLREYDKAMPLEFMDFVNANENGEMEFRVYNPNNFEVKIEFTFSYNNFLGLVKKSGVEELIIPGNSIETYETSNWACRIKCVLLSETIDYKIVEPFELIPKSTMVPKTRKLCILLDDGEICSSFNQCGGGFCVEERCNFEDMCFRRDCRCNNEEIQCPSQNRCVTRGYLELGARPYCSDQECKWNYVDENGLCAKPDHVINKEAQAEQTYMENRRLDVQSQDIAYKSQLSDKLIRYGLIVLVIITIAVLIVFMLKKRIAETKKSSLIEKQRVIQSEIELVKNLNEKINELKQLKKEKNIPDKKRIQNEIELLEEDIKGEMVHEKEYTKPYHSLTRGFWEWRNPKTNYYPCFYDKRTGKKSQTEVHKYIAEHEIFNPNRDWFTVNHPGKLFKNLVVHHIDKNIFNYDLQNLVIISRNQHKRLHAHIIHKDRATGIKALQNRGITAPHIKELAEKKNPKKYDVKNIKKEYPNAYEPWTVKEEKKLVELYRNGKTFSHIAHQLGRKPNAIRSRLIKLDVLDYSFK